MKKLFALLAVAGLILASGPSYAAATVGQPAPDFHGSDVLTNQDFKLSDHKGKIVVLEWSNHQCPFVVKHYETKNMQATQKRAKEHGNVEWVTIISSAPGMQGNVTPEEAAKIVEEEGASPDMKILDSSGEIGKLYGAQTTPHMFVIDENGTLVYAGAIDDNPSPRLSSVEGAKSYVLAAIEDLKAGQDVQVAQTQPYGCGVKYAY